MWRMWERCARSGVRGAKLRKEKSRRGRMAGVELLQEVFDLFPGFFLSPVVISDLLGANDSLAIDQKRGG